LESLTLHHMNYQPLTGDIDGVVAQGGVIGRRRAGGASALYSAFRVSLGAAREVRVQVFDPSPCQGDGVS